MTQQNSPVCGELLGSVASTSSRVDRKQTARIVSRDFFPVGLMAVASTLNPSVESLERWSQYFPQNTTVVSRLHQGPQFERIRTNRVASVPASERIRDALRYLGLTKTQLKDICTVSRQTLYDWLAGKFEPDEANSARLTTVHELALLVPLHSPVPIRARLLSVPILGHRSLLDMLRMSTLDTNQLREAVIALSRRSGVRDKDSANSLRERLGYPKLDLGAQEANLRENIDELEPI